MHLQIFAVVALTVSLACGLPAPASGNIQDPAENNRPFLVLQTNDGGSGDVNMIQLYYNLTKAGVRSIISAPPNDVTGIGAKEDDPRPLGDKGCDYKSCPPHSPATGGSKKNPDFNYVNAPPVTALKYGIDKLNPKHSGKVDLVVSGIDQNKNLNLPDDSGTIAVTRAASNLGIPAVAFSGYTKTQNE